MVNRFEIALAKARVKRSREQKEKEEKELALVKRVISQLPPAPTLDDIKKHIPQPINKTEVVREVHTKEIEKPLDQDTIRKVVEEQLAKHKELNENNSRPILPEIKVIREEMDKSDLVTKKDLDSWLKKINNAILSSTSGGSAKEIPYEGYEFISSVNDFPVADSSGIITLKRNKVYFLVGDIDLTGRRLVLEENVCLLGGSSENASLTSTGLDSNEYLITTDWTFPCRHITFKDVTKAIGVNLNNTSTDTNLALDWTGVNFTGCTVNVRCGDIDNFIYDKGAVLGSGSFEFFGEAGTIGIANSLFVGDGSASNLITIESTANITRRFRTIYTSFVAFGSTTAIDFSSSATVSNEAYILDTCNFSGGSTYLSGVDHIDNKALFVNNVGISNSADISQYYMNGNATATVISSTGVEYKVAGTTTSSSVTSKFTNTDNRATYVGALTRFFKVTATMSITSGNGNQVGAYIAKNGTIVDDSEIYITTNASGRAENVMIQTLVQLTSNDYIEIFVENNTATNNITVTDLNVIVE